ncbi:hypothetical protein LO771_07335 [Streptacidiphilus sp. ASG 303]|uniref:hypothetical protein n=1 Tax=Streptacidiphilus sp. ASG 303 TaxID=2896847 RepID=UPI001E3E7E4E|nr:hypothetical protein [Streptacidiphilus sp. ASG 303]MCD0482230.1 hypothetical protein [Streptacidiphilus sp. ASG 303]
MHPRPVNRQAVILESRTMRDSLTGWTQALDRVKALRLLPDGVHLTTRLVADYFEVGEEAVKSIVKRHREELRSNGYQMLQGVELRRYLGSTTDLSSVPGRGLALFPRRAVLNVAMLLRDSEVARQVRTHLLDLAEPARPSSALDAYVAEAARRAAEQAAEQVVERHLRSHARIIGAMSCRIARMDSALREVRSRLDTLCTLWSRRSTPDRCARCRRHR